MDWPRILAYITGTVDKELLVRNEYLVAENRILKNQIKGRLLLSDPEKKTLAEIGHRLGRKALEDVANAARPDTILGWFRKLVAQKFDGSNCVASADFTAPVGCTDDGTAVCGCDSENYATTCAATNLGVQVAFVGACPAPQAPSGCGW